MSNIDKRALREAAEKAISEEGETWWSEEQLASDYGLALHKADAKFIAAANPAAVLALLDELEAMHKYAKDRDAENEGLMITVGRLRVEKEAAEKRIVELEARKVNFSLPAELTVEDCDVLARPIEYGTGWNLAISSCEEKFIQALNAAGIRIDRED